MIGDGVPASRAGVNGVMLSNLALVLAVIALVIGGIGVMNTMLMAVIERRAEFALLSAVGWSGVQIATRVMIEGVVTTILGAALGLLLGVVGAHLLVSVLGAQEYVTPDVTAWDPRAGAAGRRAARSARRALPGLARGASLAGPGARAEIASKRRTGEAAAQPEWPAKLPPTRPSGPSA